MTTPRSTCCYKLQFRPFSLYWLCTDSPPELRKAGMGYLTPGDSSIFHPFLVSRFVSPWLGNCMELHICPLQVQEGAGRRSAKGSWGAQAVGRGCDLQACPHPKPPNSLPGVAASHTWKVRRSTERLAGTISCSSQVSAGVGQSCWGSWQDLPPCSPSEGSPQLLGAGSGQCCSISHLCIWK